MQANSIKNKHKEELGHTSHLDTTSLNSHVMRRTKRTDTDDNHVHMLLESNLNGSRTSDDAFLFPETSGDVPFECPHVDYVNRYILLCEGRWRTLL